MTKLNKFLDHLEEYFGFASLLITSILIFVQVILRYVFNHSLHWSEEVARYLMIWLIFIGGSIAVREKAHAAVDILALYVKGIYKSLLSLLASLIAIVFLVILIYSGMKMVQNVISFSNVTPAMGMPMYIPYLAIPVGSALMLIRFLQLFFAELKNIKNKEYGEEVNEGGE